MYDTEKSLTDFNIVIVTLIYIILGMIFKCSHGYVFVLILKSN